MKTTMKKLLVNILTLILLASTFLSAKPVFADENQPDTVITFTNGPTYSPDLYISKQVIASDGIDIPDVIFTFQVTVDQKTYANEVYTLWDNKGNEITTTDASGNKVTQKTDGHGKFQLKKDQTAKFEQVGQGLLFTVTEIDVPDEFVIDEPSSGSETSNIQKNGSSVVFTNRYIPNEPDPENGKVSVAKQISWPSGFEYKTDEEVEFAFVLKISGVPVNEAPFDLTEISTGKVTELYGKTDENGVFTLKPGFMATFNNLPEEEDYALEELETTGWHEVNPTLHEGSTSDGKTEYFYNTSSSFAVKKILTNGISDEDFSFQLLDQNGKAMTNVKYWLYNNDGKRVLEADGSYTDLSTGTTGQFTLKQNQTAVFMGVTPGTVYNVKELSISGYRQVTPADSNGYVNQVVSAAGNEVLPFENEILEKDGTLAVTKKLTYLTGTAPVVKRDFEFVLYRKDVDPGTNEPILVPQAGKVYTVDNSLVQFTTDAEGKFTLKENETAFFEKLSLGRTYVVEELLTNDVTYGVLTSEELTSDGKYQKEGILVSGELLPFTFKNTYEGRHLELQILKKDDRTNEVLSGIEFGIYTDEACTVPAFLDDSGAEITFTTDTDGKIILDLPAGDFYLKELHARLGYAKLKDVAHIYVSQHKLDANGVEIIEASIVNEDELSAFSSVLTNDETITTVTLEVTVLNKKLVSLPSAGGKGVILFSVIGSVIMLLAIAFFVMRRKAKN